MHDKEAIEKSLTKLNSEVSAIIEENKFDISGAIKGSFFHHRLGEIVKDTIKTEDGEILKQATGKTVGFFYITIRDLLRVNKEGTHEEGDKVLIKCVQKVGQQLTKLNISNFEIYHILGADFICICNISQDNVPEITKTLSDITINFENASQPAHLSVYGYTIKQLIEDGNKGLELENDKSLNKNISRHATSVLVQAINYGIEYNKLIDTIADFKSCKKGQKDFYDMYIKYLFDPVPTIKKLLEMSSTDIETLCIQTAYEKTHDDEPSYAGVLKTQIKYLYKNPEEALNKIEKTRTQLEKIPENKPETYENFNEQVKNYRTQKSKWFENVSQLFYQATSTEDNDCKICKELVKVFISEPKLCADYGPLLEKYVESVKDLDKKIILKTIETGYRRALINYDDLTGLKNKEQAKKEVGKFYDQNINFSIINIDLAYLKYFNVHGGRKTVGDLAIKKAAYIVDLVKQNCLKRNLEVEVCRSGGDEFTFVSNVNAEQATNIADEIEGESIKKGPVPAAPTSKQTYLPERIRFNAGITDLSETKNLLFKLAKIRPKLFNKIELTALTVETPNPEQREIRKKLVIDTMFKFADILQEINKKTDRFEFLLHRYSDFKNSKTGDMSYFETILAFSGKALGGFTIKDFDNIAKYAAKKHIDISSLDCDQLQQLIKVFFKKQSRVPANVSKETNIIAQLN